MSDALFDASPTDPPLPTREVRRPKPLEDDGSPSPFGSAMPEDLPLAEPSTGFGSAFDKGAPRKRPSKARDHYRRCIDFLETRYGGYFWVCDGFKAGAGGQLVSTDLLGLMDLQGVTREGRLIGANVTSAGQVDAHIRDYTNPSRTHGQAKTPVPTILRRLLAHNVRFVVLGYSQEGGKGSRWSIEETVVDEAKMREFEGRKRGARGKA